MASPIIQKIFVSTRGNPSVGIQPAHMTIECYLDSSDSSPEDLEAIRKKAAELLELIEGEKAYAAFDFECQEKDPEPEPENPL